MGGAGEARAEHGLSKASVSAFPKGLLQRNLGTAYWFNLGRGWALCPVRVRYEWGRPGSHKALAAKNWHARVSERPPVDESGKRLLIQFGLSLGTLSSRSLT
jgi:hypothetical protein